MLLESAERFLGEHSSSQVVRAAAGLPSGVDMALWSRVTEELGWQVVAIPEACDGLGLGAVELVILLEKLGEVIADPVFRQCARSHDLADGPHLA